MPQKKKKAWWQHALAIPGVMVFDIVVFVLLCIADELLMGDGGGQGHGAPAFSLMGLPVLGIISVIVIVRAVVLTLSTLFGVQKEEAIPISAAEKSSAPIRRRNALKYLLVVLVQIGISIVIVFTVGYFEINAFYNRPDHIGFAIPIITLIVAAGLLVITVIVAIVCLILALRKPKQPR